MVRKGGPIGVQHKTFKIRLEESGTQNQTVNWECRSCRGIEDITHLHSNYSHYSSINHRKAGIVINESDMELYNRKSNTYTINNDDRYGGGGYYTMSSSSMPSSDASYPSKAKQKDDGKGYMISNNRDELYADMRGWDYGSKLDKITLPESGLQFYNGISNGDLFNIFYEKDYDFLPVKDRVVIDIGANIADSSIYFAMSGAKKVIALEPFPKNFEIGQKNIALNGFTDKIELLNAGCGAQSKDMVLDASAEGVGCQAMQSGSGSNIHFYTLQELVDKYNIDSHAVLKLDCEGCEYDIILSNGRTILDKFSDIQIEYHYGFRDLKKHMIGASFAVSHTNPREENGMEIGWIYASKS